MGFWDKLTQRFDDSAARHHDSAQEYRKMFQPYKDENTSGFREIPYSEFIGGSPEDASDRGAPRTERGIFKAEMRQAIFECSSAEEVREVFEHFVRRAMRANRTRSEAVVYVSRIYEEIVAESTGGIA